MVVKTLPIIIRRKNCVWLVTCTLKISLFTLGHKEDKSIPPKKQKGAINKEGGRERGRKNDFEKREMRFHSMNLNSKFKRIYIRSQL